MLLVSSQLQANVPFLLCNIGALTWALMISACDVLCFLRLCSLFCLMGVKYGVWSMQLAGSAFPLFII